MKLAHSQVWKHDWGTHYIVTKCENGFRLTSLSDGTAWAGDQGFNGSVNFTFIGMASDVVRVEPK